MSNFKKTYITTPIYYPNANLHVGHAYTTTLADVLARFRKLEGKEVFFVTGSDEHGQKLFDKAKENNQEVFDYVTNIVDTFKNLWSKLDVEYDLFIRTTDETHKQNVQDVFQFLYDKKLIYKGTYKGFYCKSDESYFTEHQLKEGRCPECGKAVEEFEEESFFLKVSAFKEWISKTLQNDNILFPAFRVNELMNNFVDKLEDLSISRKNFAWGVNVPNNENYVIYVWFDALINYLSAFKYEQAPFSLEQWNDDDVEIVQFLGKEIIRFHAIYWPILLKELNLKIPKLLAHGWLVVDGEKMSKSVGNVIDPISIIDSYGSDALRFYLVKNISFGSDGKFSIDGLIENYNGILVNKYSNLVNRTFAMNAKYFDGVVPNANVSMEQTKLLDTKLKGIEKNIFLSMDKYDFNTYIDLLISYLDHLNLYIDQTTPWLEKDNDKLKEIIWFLINRVYSISVLFNPIIPQKSNVVIKLFNDKPEFGSLFININNIKLEKSLILFERIKNDTK